MNKYAIYTFVVSLFVLTSCVNTKKAVYFVSLKDGELPQGVVLPEAKIQQNDLLSITVTSLNPQATAVFNTPNVSTVNASGYNNAIVQSSGYLVNPDGTIQFPILGTIAAAGLTESQLRNLIVKSLTDKKLLVDPIVSVRHLNFKVTVLGEVGNPTVITVPSERISLLEALGLAGDITIYGKKENVMVIREEGGRRVMHRLNLNEAALFNSPYYYLQSNDVVYVEPNKAKVAGSTRGNQLLPIVLSGLSFAAIIIDRATR